MKTCEQIYTKMCKIEKNAKPKLGGRVKVASLIKRGRNAATLYTQKSPREKKTSRAELMARSCGRGK